MTVKFHSNMRIRFSSKNVHFSIKYYEETLLKLFECTELNGTTIDLQCNIITMHVLNYAFHNINVILD